METLTVERLKQANQIVKKINLPVQPKVVIEINREVSQEEPNFKKIAELVSKDVGLTAKVIHVINSPFFGVTREVTNIVQALSLMGLENFKKVILTTCLREAIGNQSDKDQSFWDHSLRTALAAQHIANGLSSVLMIDDITPDHAYMAGLFHDSTIPIFMRRTPEYVEVCSQALSHKSDTVQTEEDIVGTDHCCVGAMMAKSWSLSTTICKAILHHHVSDYNSIERDEPPTKLIATIQLADYIAYNYDYSVGGVDLVIENDWDTDEWAYYHRHAMDELHLTEEDVNDYKMEVFELLSQE